MEKLPKEHRAGTHRLVPPAATLERIQPHLERFGITRCADITGLDAIGIPVYVAVRPQGRILQTANGKGLEHVDAQVSALMEAIEQWHAENPNVLFEKSTYAALRRDGSDVVAPDLVEGFYRSSGGDAERYDWILGENLTAGRRAWLPGFAAYYCARPQQPFSYNGLASGNHLVEATLHALYELIERRSLALLSRGADIELHRCDAIDLATIHEDSVAGLVERIKRAGLDVVLLRVPCISSAHTFMSVIVDPRPFANASRVNIGSGAHLSPTVAAIRAITEAAQSRLTFIHGSRDDLTEDAYNNSHDQAFSFFANLEPDSAWAEIEDVSSDDLFADYERLLDEHRRAGDSVYRVDVSQGIAGVTVVKVLIPGVTRPPWL